MKTTNLLLMVMTVGSLLLNVETNAQEEAKEAKYYTVATFHWNMDYENFDMDT
ncbi:MAG: hypothetical protein KAJ23_04830 [Maribacter sp.]|nr:hypothetical protein [Maribacter sp.]